MKYEFFIPGPLPGLNEILKAAHQLIPHLSRGRRKVFAYTQLKSKWTIHICRIFLSKNIQPVKSVSIEFIWIEPNRKRDLDNIAVGKKFILDAMVKSGIIENDGWKQILKMTDKFAVSKENPGVIVKIEDADLIKTEDK